MKYDPLKTYLQSCSEERITLTFKQVEDILSFSLPKSARQYQAWWSNGGQSHSGTWMDVGYKVYELSFTREYVVFVRSGMPVMAPAEKTGTATKTRSPKQPNGDSRNVARIRNYVAPASDSSVSQDIPRRITEDIITVCGYRFSFIQELIPECDANGCIREFRPQSDYHKDKPLNAYGDGSFCRFTIHAGNRPGVYLWVIDKEIIYIGETAGLARRFNTGYGVIAPVNCYVGGQTTNCKMNKVVMEMAKVGRYVKLYFHETEEYKRVELELLRQINTKYNVKDN